MRASQFLQGLSNANSTKSTQSSYWKSFLSFCQLFGLSALPCEPYSLVLFVAYKTMVLHHAVPTVWVLIYQPPLIISP